MSADAWEEATFEGLERAQRRRFAGLTPQERLRACEDMVRFAHEVGQLVAWRERKQREVMAAWESGRRH
jgi:hypothetical protein